MKPLRLFLLLLLAQIAIVASAADMDTIVIKGMVKDSLGNGLPVAIVDQRETQNFVFSKPDGSFELVIISRFGEKLLNKVGIPLTVSLVGYNSQVVNATTENHRAMEIIMIEGDGRISKRKPKKWKTIHSLSGYIGYEYMDLSFKRFTDLTINQRAQLNKIKHYFGFGFNAYIRNIYVDIGFAFTPTYKEMNKDYRQYTEGTNINFKLGYGFPFYNQRLIVTPFYGSTYLGLSEYIAPLERKVSLDSYLDKGYMDILFKQYVGTVGGKVDYRLYEFDRSRQALYLSAGVGYSFRLNKYPYISAKGTRITSPNTIAVFPVSCEVSVKYMFNFFTRKKAKQNN